MRVKHAYRNAGLKHCTDENEDRHAYAPISGG